MLLGCGIEPVGGILEPLVFEKLPYQFGPGVGYIVILELGDIGFRQEHRRLDLDKGRRHHEEIAC